MSSDYTAGQVLTAAELNASFDGKVDEADAMISGGQIEGVDHIYITGTAVSTSPTTGALTVSGGAGVEGMLNVGGNITTAQQLYSSLTTDSTSSSTGAIVSAGGAGIAKSLMVGGSATIAGALNAASAALTTALPITSGGTGANNAASALTNILGSSTVPVSNGGTGANNASAALSNLGALPLTGGSLTGSLTVAASSGAVTINDTSGTGASAVYLQSSAISRWGFVNNSGSGNGLGVNRYVSGTYAGTPISISNSTGVTTFSARPIFGSATPWDSSNLASPASLTGSTFTGAVSFSNGSASITGAAGTNRALVYQTAGVARWWAQTSNDSESGSNAGTNFLITRANDAGAVIDSPVTINRASGLVTLADGLVSNSSSNAITGGAINNATIGATTRAAGNFTALAANGGLTVSGGGTIDGAAIGSTTASSGKFTTLAASGLISPTSTIGIAGTNAADNPQAGSVGEYVASSVPAGNAMSLATATNLASISLTPGDWDVTGNASYTAGTTIIQCVTSINTTSATSAGSPYQTQQTVSLGSGQVFTQIPMTTRISIASTTTVYLVGFLNGTGSPTFAAVIRARRVR